MKKRVRQLIVIVGTLMIFSVMLYLFNGYLDRQIPHLYSEVIERECGNQSEYVLKKSVEDGNLLLLGSSELYSPVKQCPIYMYPNSKIKADVTIDGTAHVQSMLHAMNLTSLQTDHTEELKLAIVVSLQWFMGEDIDHDGFAANFSQLQFMNLISSDKISSENKKYVCKRTLELLKDISAYEDIKVLAATEKSDNKLVKFVGAALKPYYAVKYQLLKMRDKYEVYAYLKDQQGNPVPQYDEVNKNMDWTTAFEDAEQEGKASCTNNEFFVEDEYYNTYLKDIIGNLKNSKAGIGLTSKEREDFLCFLSICDDLKIKPYIVMMNTNGYYYDYVGICQETRSELYQWVKDQSEAHGFECLTMTEKEYEPYFMVDVMHLGWKGWLYVNQKISEYYAEY